MSEHAGTGSLQGLRRVGARIRPKLPEILIEAMSVVCAVLLALAVDEYRQDRENASRAARARESILAELRTNRDLLRRSLNANRKGLAAIAPEEELGPGSKTKLELGLVWYGLSSAAWQSAQNTQAMNRMDYNWLIKTAAVYEFQFMYGRHQEELFRHIGVASTEPDKRIGARAVRGRLFMLLQVAENLIQMYDGALAQ
jgi:hypothetical protein